MTDKSFLNRGASPFFSLLCAAAIALPAAARAQDSTSAPVLVAQPVQIMKDSATHPAIGVLELRASLATRTLSVMRGDSLLGQYPVAIGADEHPTPRGEFFIRKIIWNPSWHPPDVAWAKGKKPQDPGDAANPMKVVKIFFQEPDYYIHGTGAIESLGKAESHGCLRMDPDQAAQVARLIMEHGGQPREENWFWRVLHFRRETKTVSLDNPIRMVIDD